MGRVNPLLYPKATDPRYGMKRMFAVCKVLTTWSGVRQDDVISSETIGRAKGSNQQGIFSAHTNPSYMILTGAAG